MERKHIVFGAAAVLGIVALSQAAARADVVYNSIPASLPTNLPSVGYQATQTAQFGDAVTLAGTARAVTKATVILSNWALESTYETVGTSAGYFEPMTLSLYNFGGAGPNPVVGSLIASSSINAFIPWRPEATAGCGTAFSTSPGGQCFNGLAVPMTFNFAGESVPDNVIFGLAFNTETWGANPIGHPGPFNSLNFALSGEPDVTVGTDVNPDGVEWNTATLANLTAGGPGQVGVFGPDIAWAPFVPAVTLEAIPEPGSLALLVPAVLGLVATRRRRT